MASPVAWVRLRTDASRPDKRVEGATAIIWTMRQVAEPAGRKLHAPERLPLVTSGMMFKDGIVLKSGHEKNDRNHQPERTAA
ncbi:MAG: hypothetical protein NNA18_05105 [Nitrospira sp.]|nr:hypothetical protein [Nitrospira sp.]